MAKTYAKRFPEIFQILAGYFMQEWSIHFYQWSGGKPDFREVVYLMKAEMSLEELSKVVSELKEFLNLRLTEEELIPIVGKDFGCYFYPSEMSCSEFLKKMISILEAPKSDEDQKRSARRLEQTYTPVINSEIPQHGKTSELSQFFSSTFHKYWQEDFAGIDFDQPLYILAVRSFINNRKYAVVKKVFEELGEFKFTERSEIELEDALRDDLHCYFSFTNPNLTPLDFLNGIYNVFEERVKSWG